jgi:hypothetical protein
MKKILILTVALILAAGLIFAAETPGKKMRVVVEGMTEDASNNTADVRIATQKDIEIARLKAMSQGTKMEKEIIDALIVKTINLEEEVANIRKTEIMLLGLFSALLVLVIALILAAWKKPKV